MWGRLCQHTLRGEITGNGKCVVPVKRSSSCGHVRWIPCFEFSDLERNPGNSFGLPTPNFRCLELNEIIHPCEKHMYFGDCCDSIQPKNCGYLCNRRLPCGHHCENSCHADIQEEPKRKEGESWGQRPEEPSGRYENFNCPPCSVRKEEGKLPCGHVAVLPCHNKEAFITSYVCEQRCTRMINCGHMCDKKCGEPCLPCKTVVKKSRPAICPHHVVAECFVDAYDVWCPQMVVSDPPSTCGHDIYIHCGKGFFGDPVAKRELLKMCKSPCEATLGCEHKCSGICCECLQGRFHGRCKNPCNKFLQCGHKCEGSCSEPCPPCKQPCYYKCSHRQCDSVCSEACKDCQETCAYSCPHDACTKNCDEPCNREPCEEPCDKLIPQCGHPCLGFCGEPCPPYCFVCSKDKLEEGNLLGEIPEENDRYIFLPDCGHVVEVDSMEGWINSRGKAEEITPICCPICRSVISSMKRYWRILHINKRDVKMINTAINGDPRENRKKWVEIVTAMKDYPDTTFADFKKFVLNFLKINRQLYKAEVECISQYWDFITSTSETLRGLRKELPKNRLEHLEEQFRFIFQLLEGRQIPLTAAEVENFNREYLRIQYAVDIQKRHGKNVSKAVKDFVQRESTQEKFNKIYNHLLHPSPFTPAREQEFLLNLKHYDKLLNISLNISEEEKRAILQAFGNQTGHWFKCPNGHVYIITECGGALEIGMCPECGEAIGGDQHRAFATNTLAPEMDGAEAPLYPNSVQVLEFFGNE